MYALMTIKSGCTLTELATDIRAVLTGTVSAASELVGCVVASSEVVKTVNPEWTFVQYLANTVTRVHMVFAGVDDKGVPKTMGILLVVSGTTLSALTWTCGEWNSTTKKPAALPMAGRSTGAGTAAEYGEDGVRNGISTQSQGFTPTSIGIFNAGGFQLQIFSQLGYTAIYTHLNGAHRAFIEIVNIPRDYLGPVADPVTWPFPQFIVAMQNQNGTVNAPCVGMGLDTTNLEGVIFGPSASSTWATIPAASSADFGTGLRTWGAGSPAHSQHSVSYTLDTGGMVASYNDGFSSKYYVRPRNLIHAYSVANLSATIPIPKTCPGSYHTVGSASLITVDFLSEIDTPTGIWVGTGSVYGCLLKE